MKMDFTRALYKIKNSLDLLNYALVSLTKKSYTTKKNYSQKLILFSASDGNLSCQKNGKFYSPIFEPIKSYFIKKKYNVLNLNFPLSCIDGKSVRQGAILINTQAIKILLFYFLERCIYSEQKCLKRKKFRRFKLLLRLIKKYKPKIIFAIQATQELCLAAHRQGIKVIEPMHGTFLSKNDKYFIPSVLDIKKNQLPDTYLAYDQETKTTLIHYLQSKESKKIYVIPHPGLLEKNNKYKTKKASSFSINNTVLYTTQWGYDNERDSLKNIISNGILHQSIKNIISSNKNLFWKIKIHPVQLRYKRYKKHLKFFKRLVEDSENCEITNSSKETLKSCLENSAVHITMSSGSVYEALALQKPTLLLCPSLKKGNSNHGLFSCLQNNSLVTFGTLDEKYIFDWICKNQISQKNKKHSILYKLHINKLKLIKTLNIIEKTIDS